MAHYQAYYMYVCMYIRTVVFVDHLISTYSFFKTWCVEKGALVCHLI